jgi:hypothetical protein
MKLSLLTIAFAFVVFFCSAQVKIGSGTTTTVHPSALLELSNNLSESPYKWKTFLPPQVDFTHVIFSSASVWGVSGSPILGAVVFNIGNAISNGFAGPGLYCWIGDRWSLIGYASPVITVEDKLRKALSASLTAYDTAVNNSWVMISAPEYQNILSVVQGASQYAAKDSFMNLPSEIAWNQLYTVGGNAAVPQIPPSNYIVAWSVRTGVYFTSSSHHSKIKVSSSQLTGYTELWAWVA